MIVAIANYPKESGWNSIHSNNDLQILLPQFDRLGFRINTLTDKHATKKNIIQALQHLIKQLKAGDDVCLHFSCHGQQMEDDNGDEADELDEALIPMMPNPHTKKAFMKERIIYVMTNLRSS